jgi:two-component system CheB/CheR fusion protein
LDNVLYSNDLATLFLDLDMNIRFFTPATKALFAILPTDVGRPLSDLNAMVADTSLLIDARTVLRIPQPIEREIEARNGAIYQRRVLPYRTGDGGVEGVVITFANITDRRRAADELGVAKRNAEQANAAKSRFLAAASHDLRQPLQTLALVQGLLAKTVESEKARKLVSRLDQTLGAMTDMLNALLDINQIETGTIHAEMTDFPIDELLNQLRDEFSYHALAKGLTLKVMPCRLSVRSDPRLLEQMVRNLIANALKYTMRGKVLLGCRRHGERLTIEIWDTGIGIAESELKAIFEEYHQIDNPARERSRGLGLGLSIVHRLGGLLGHPVNVRSRPGKGSVFSVEVARPPAGMAGTDPGQPPASAGEPAAVPRRTGAILLIEDDPDIRDLLNTFLTGDGHDVTMAEDGIVALDLVKRGAIGPGLILTDYNLPHDMDGTRAVALLREALHRKVPAIVLTGDISIKALSAIALADCVHLAKPVRLPDLDAAVQRLLSAPDATAPGRVPPAAGDRPPVIFVVDDDEAVREAIRDVLEDDGRTVVDFPTCESFLATYRPGQEACLILDAYLPGMDGLALLKHMKEDGQSLPAIMITGSGDVQIAVQAMKAGAVDFIEKPIGRTELLTNVDRALDQARDSGKLASWRQDAANHLAGDGHGSGRARQ